MKCGPHYAAIKELHKYLDLFQATDAFIEEKFNTYQAQMRGITKDMANLTIDCRAKFRSAEL
jgi:hypothetical protein